MDTIIIVLLLLVLVELTYLLTQNPRKSLRNTGGRPIFVDTSVLIDGRITAIAASGFIGDTLYIPRSVVGELQFLADKADGDKRARARHGLDVVRELQNMPQASVKIFPDGSKAEEGVDERLLKLAKQHGGAICTIDYNLNKVAQVEDITVLNVNELAQNLRMAYLPGEKVILELTQKGNDSHQAVGHLGDGTMVVVEQASKYVGKKVEIEFIRSLQTAAGRMMFAKVVPQSISTPVAPKAVAATKAKSIGRRPQQQQSQTERQELTKPLPKQPEQAKKPEVVRKPTRSAQSTQQPAKKPTANNQNRRRRPADAESSLVDLANR
ncbi:MAG: PIN/TRAM domain-containing protein [Candidatus Saccharimonadales bacterium]